MTDNQIKFYTSLKVATYKNFCYNAPRMAKWEAHERKIDQWFADEYHKDNIKQINKLSDHFDKKKRWDASVVINKFLLKNYYSPHTKVGQRRFYNSMHDLYGSDDSDYESASEDH